MSVSPAFKTDKYEITMIQAALESGVAHKPAVFEVFARKLPRGRRYGVVGGVERLIQEIRSFVFTDEQLTYLETQGINARTVDYLRSYRFMGTIKAYGDGDLYFPYSPIFTVEASFADGVILETLILSILNHDSAIASAGARMVEAAQGKLGLIEMGSRRTHEDAAVAAARMAHIVGFDFTSNLEAGLRHNIPTTGTSAHAFTLAHKTEVEAFQAQVKALGENTSLLVDTYDIATGIENAVKVAGPELGGIRIDSGDLVEETFKARAQLDALGAVNTKIVLSSDMDEYSIDELVQANAPVNAAGVGTRLVTGSGAPTASMVYKLVEIDGRPVAKASEGKVSIGGRKTAWRTYDGAGVITGEHFTTGDAPKGVEVLNKVRASNGEFFRVALFDLRANHHAARASLPEDARFVADGEAAFICAQA